MTLINITEETLTITLQDPTIAIGSLSGIGTILLNAARAHSSLSGGNAFVGADPMWNVLFGEPFADAGAHNASSPTHTFEGATP